MSLKVPEGGIGSKGSFPYDIVLPVADQREERRAPKPPLFFLSKEGFVFLLLTSPDWNISTADQREARAAPNHAVHSGWKLWKSFRLACCISRAASVSD